MQMQFGFDAGFMSEDVEQLVPLQEMQMHLHGLSLHHIHTEVAR